MVKFILIIVYLVLIIEKFYKKIIYNNNIM